MYSIKTNAYLLKPTFLENTILNNKYIDWFCLITFCGIYFDCRYETIIYRLESFHIYRIVKLPFIYR